MVKYHFRLEMSLNVRSTNLIQMKNASFQVFFYSILKSKSLLFSLITSRSNQGLYTILHDFLQIVVDNVDIVVSGCPISFPCQLLRYSDLLCQFDLYRHLSHQQSGVEPQLHQHDTNFYSLQWFSGSLVLAISRELRIIFFDQLLLLLTRNQLVDTLKMEDCSVTKYYISVFFTLKMIIPQDSLSYFVSSKYSGFFIFVCTSS